MRARTLPVILLTLIAAGPASAPLSAGNERSVTSFADAPIKRFMQVGPNLYRGGQPDAEGFAYLRDLGIRTVVSFRNDDSERALVERLGMAFVHMPVTFRPFGGRMPPDVAARFLAMVDNPRFGPVFVHCKRGADRTGAFVGLYRMLRQGWDLERAYQEARDIGMRWWYVAVKRELANLARTIPPPSVADGR